MSFSILFVWCLAVASLAMPPPGPSSCSLRSDTNMVYSLANGVGDASRVWIEDLLWWWKSHDSTINYQGLTAEEIQNCELANYPNLRVFLNPGGDAYNQLSSLGTAGRANILAFIQRQAESAYVGFCAGGYLASTGYYWETMLEDVAYFEKYGTAPPLGVFPYNVEGSIVDIADDQFSDLEQPGVKYRLVNVSNGQKMLYYGGSTLGWNQADAISQNAEVEVLAYYTDFYGYLSYNLPAAWKYQNLLLTSVHPEADNCTSFDCPAEGTLPQDDILQNRAWLVTYINQVAGTSFKVPDVPVKPVFDTTPPHENYPIMQCYKGTTPRRPPTLFCDDFDASEGVVPSGLWNWQRSQTSYSSPRPWNTSFTTKYGHPANGNGYALAVQQANSNDWASISTFPVSTPAGSSVTFNRRGAMSVGGLFTVQYTVDGGVSWTNLAVQPLSELWQEETFPLPVASSLQVRFNCGGTGLCALDSVSINAPEAVLHVV